MIQLLRFRAELHEQALPRTPSANLCRFAKTGFFRSAVPRFHAAPRGLLFASSSGPEGDPRNPRSRSGARARPHEGRLSPRGRVRVRFPSGQLTWRWTRQSPTVGPSGLPLAPAGQRRYVSWANRQASSRLKCTEGMPPRTGHRRGRARPGLPSLTERTCTALPSSASSESGGRTRTALPSPACSMIQLLRFRTEPRRGSLQDPRLLVALPRAPGANLHRDAKIVRFRPGSCTAALHRAAVARRPRLLPALHLELRARTCSPRSMEQIRGAGSSRAGEPSREVRV